MSAIAHAVSHYEHDLIYGRLPFSVSDVRRELRGKDLACWCPLPAEGEPDLCHARILLEIANHCDHKFVDSNVCLKCGVHVRELRRAPQIHHATDSNGAMRVQAGAKGRHDRGTPLALPGPRGTSPAKGAAS